MFDFLLTDAKKNRAVKIFPAELVTLNKTSMLTWSQKGSKQLTDDRFIVPLPAPKRFNFQRKNLVAHCEVHGNNCGGADPGKVLFVRKDRDCPLATHGLAC